MIFVLGFLKFLYHFGSLHKHLAYSYNSAQGNFLLLLYFLFLSNFSFAAFLMLV